MSGIAVDQLDGSNKGGKPKGSLTPWRKPKEPKQDTFPGLRSLNGKWGYLFVAPFVVMFLIFGLAPVAYSIYVAFFMWDPLGDQTFVGLDNFYYLLQDDTFWISIYNTFSIWGWSTFPQLVISIGIAAVLRNRFLRAQTFWRTILLVPNITSVLAVAIVFGQLFGRDFGIINQLLGVFGIPNIDFVETPLAAHIAIAVMITWRWAGYNALIFLAAMLAIPDELYESAALDGASKWQQFRYVTLPGLRNTITFVLVIGTIGGLQVFAEPLTLGGSTSGGTEKQFSTLTLFLYDRAFVGGDWGYGAAIGIMITFIVLIISAINYFLTNRIGRGEK